MDKALKDMIDEQGRLIEQFSAAAKADFDNHTADTEQKLDAINAAITEVQEKIKTAQQQEAERVDELEVKLNRIQLGAGQKETRDIEQDVKVFKALRTGGPVMEVSDADIAEYTAYCKAFAVYARRGGQVGETLPERLKNELSVGSDPDGGFWVPATTGTRIITRMFDTSPIRPISGSMTITTDALELPKDTDEAASGGWVTEKGTRAETGTPQIGVQRIPVHEQYAEPHATQRILDDAAVDVEGWLANKIAGILTRTENTSFVTGNGVGKPRGFLDYASAAVTTEDASRAWGVLQYVPTGTSGGFGKFSGTQGDEIGPLIDVIHKIKGAMRGNARWLMNRFTLAVCRKLRDADGNLMWQQGLVAGEPGLLLGYPITEAEDMPDVAANSYSIAFGNFSEGYLIVDRQGIRVLRDPYTSKPFVKFYTTKRVGADVVNFDAIKLVKFGTT